MRRTGQITIVFVALAGLVSCAPEAYRKSADLQVQKLLEDRQKRTLDYAPQVEAPVQTPARPTRKSYEKLPASPVPPAMPPVLEPSRFELGYGRLGPEELYPPGTESPQRQPLSVEEARKPGLDRLRLGPPAELAPIQTFDLFDAIAYAVQHSREYQSRMEDLYLAALSVTLERHLFSPRPFARTGVEYTGGQLDVDYRSALTITNSAGIRQQLPYGGEIVAEGLVDFVRALNDNVSDGESAQLALSGTIPLLRGAGMVNLESLINSERQLVYEVRRFEDFRRDFVVRIASQYFRLLTQQQAIANRRFTYIVAYQLTEQTYAIYAAGRPGVNFLSVQRAQNQLYEAENAIINAEDNYQAALDDFKLLIGMPVDEPLEVVGMELDINPPDLEADATQMALKYRLDLKTASDQIEDARRAVEVAKNGLLPDLELRARGSIGNQEDSPASHIDSRTMEYSAGLTLDLPVDRLAERNAYRRALISLERATRNWKQTRDSIIAQVRDSLRAIRSARDTLEIQRRTIELNRRRLDYANELLVLGRATDSQQVVDAQNALLQAQDRYEQARANYQIRILEFLRDTGMLRINPQAGSLGLAMDRGHPGRRQRASTGSQVPPDRSTDEPDSQESSVR
ncbi:TolC family protein [Fontivita pretiosa]|uniref:TolC family protein n=1 Tax=Fontivita pretiosa TaxID=2989684 RepID=UPI003D185BB0